MSIAMEEYDLLEDPKYRSYITQVDRCLKYFESTTEWADLIAALSKLNRVLQAHMKYPIIPRRIVISKRLAQCMHPALPAGVHQKALETYDIIFKCMGTNRLAAELFIYSAGLFPLLANAALNVRSLLLTVYETHFVPLGQRLRPGLNGFLSGVLPGLEEGSDHYQRTNSLLESVVEAVNPFVFYSALWECVAANATVRLPALTFVLSHCGNKRSRAAAMEEPPTSLAQTMTSCAEPSASLFRTRRRWFSAPRWTCCWWGSRCTSPSLCARTWCAWWRACSTPSSGGTCRSTAASSPGYSASR
jgi:hypothetical protein